MEHAKVISFDIAFLGIVMPRMNGLELGIQIRKLLRHCAVMLGVEDIPGTVECAKSLARI